MERMRYGKYVGIIKYRNQNNYGIYFKGSTTKNVQSKRMDK